MLVMFIGGQLRITHTILYPTFLVVYLGLLFSVFWRLVDLNGWHKYVENWVKDPILWLEIVSSIVLANVTLSDFLHQLMTSAPSTTEDPAEDLGSMPPSLSGQKGSPVLAHRSSKSVQPGSNVATAAQPAVRRGSRNSIPRSNTVIQREMSSLSQHPP
jgi:hypothetical protein